MIGNQLSYDGMAFVRDYVFPRSHADLLSVQGPYKKAPKVPGTASEADGLEDNALQLSA